MFHCAFCIKNRTNECFITKQFLFLYVECLNNQKMNIELSQRQIGQRIMEQRKMKGFSQEELARSIHMSRPSLAQIELGNRSVNVLEIMKLSRILGFSLDDFISMDYNVVNEVETKYEAIPKKLTERKSVPDFNIDKFINVLLYILERCAGKPNIGETVLLKLLYFSDFNHYELYEEHLTGSGYRKLPFGPVPQKFEVLVDQMINNGLIQRVKTEYFKKTLTRFIPLVRADLTEMKASEKEVIDRVIDQMGDWSEAAITAYSHQDIPWLATKEGEEINYELAFYREAPFSVRTYDLENAVQ